MKSFLHVAHITSPLKEGVDEALHPKTVIVGPNGSGKSAIVDSLTLALAGRIFDVSGRDGFSSPAEIFSLVPPQFNDCVATATLSDGRQFVWSSKRTERGGSRPQHIQPTRVRFPAREVADNLCGSPDTARAYLLAQMGGAVSRTDVLALLDAKFHEAYVVAARDVSIGIEIDVLQAIRHNANADAVAKKKEADALTATLSALASNLPPLPLEEDRAQARAAALEAGDYMQRVQAAWQLADTQERVSRDAQTHYEELTALLAQSNALTAKLAELPPTNPTLKVQREAVAVNCMLATNGQNACLVCGTVHDPAHFFQKFNVLESPETEAKRAALEQEVRTLAVKIEATGRLLAARRAELASFPPVAPTSKAVLEAAIQDYNARTAESHRLDSIQAQWTNVHSMRQRQTETQERAIAAAAFENSLVNVVAGLVDTALQRFTARVQEYLPKTDKFELRIAENGKNTCRFGLVRNGQLHTALSGAEWGRVTLALACAVCKDEGPDCLIIITPYEERAYDAGTLANVLRALKDASAQVIITSPVKPLGVIPAGWKMITRAHRVYAEDSIEEGGEE